MPYPYSDNLDITLQLSLFQRYLLVFEG